MSPDKADYVTREGKLVIDDPEIRRRLIRTMGSYTAIYRKGCTPPGAVGWDDRGNNQAFLARAVVMTVNGTLSIPNALRAERPEDYELWSNLGDEAGGGVSSVMDEVTVGGIRHGGGYRRWAAAARRGGWG
jgi:hypothetical protein